MTEHVPPQVPDRSDSEFKLPGSQASIFVGGSAAEMLLRSVLRHRGRLGGFALSFVLHQPSCSSSSTSQSGVFPLPVPYPEVFEAGSIRVRRPILHRKKFVNALIILLNFLHYRRPRSVKGFSFRRQLTGRQWEVVRRFEYFAEAWLVSRVGPEEMGRTAGKVESLEKLIRKLRTQASAL